MNLLTEQEQEYLRRAIDAAIKSSPDSIAASQVLIPILAKCCQAKSIGTETK